MDELEFWKERARTMERFADRFALMSTVFLLLLWFVLFTR